MYDESTQIWSSHSSSMRSNPAQPVSSKLGSRRCRHVRQQQQQQQQQKGGSSSSSRQQNEGKTLHQDKPLLGMQQRCVRACVAYLLQTYPSINCSAQEKSYHIVVVVGVGVAGTARSIRLARGTHFNVTWGEFRLIFEKCLLNASRHYFTILLVNDAYLE